MQAGNIHKSLLTLGSVIRGLADHQVRVSDCSAVLDVGLAGLQWPHKGRCTLMHGQLPFLHPQAALVLPPMHQGDTLQCVFCAAAEAPALQGLQTDAAAAALPQW